VTRPTASGSYDPRSCAWTRADRVRPLTCTDREPPRWRRAVIHYHRIVSGP